MFFDHSPAMRAGASMSRVVLAAVALALSQPVLASEAKRIVSLGGSVTEILYALGVEDRIVGIDSTSLYPARALKSRACLLLRPTPSSPLKERARPRPSRCLRGPTFM